MEHLLQILFNNPVLHSFVWNVLYKWTLIWCWLEREATWEELFGGSGDLGLLGDAVSVIGTAGATGRAEARDFLHALGERGNLQSPQHIHWVWGEKAQKQNCYFCNFKDGGKCVKQQLDLMTKPKSLSPWWTLKKQLFTILSAFPMTQKITSIYPHLYTVLIAFFWVRVMITDSERLQK